MTQEEFTAWCEEAVRIYPNDDSKHEGYMQAVQDLAVKLRLNLPGFTTQYLYSARWAGA